MGGIPPLHAPTPACHATQAILCANKGHDTRIWAREPEVVAAINDKHENVVFLPGFKCPEQLKATGDMAAAIAGAELLLMVIPTPFVAATLGAQLCSLGGLPPARLPLAVRRPPPRPPPAAPRSAHR
jgi:hypothetical protein